MRSCAILILLFAFVTAVLMPNEIGTQSLPATGSKSLKLRQHHPLKVKAVAWVALTRNVEDLCSMSDACLIVARSAQSFARVQFSAPLLI
jgi:hypothetical protein